jgi:hypothetical protein
MVPFFREFLKKKKNLSKETKAKQTQPQKIEPYDNRKSAISRNRKKRAPERFPKALRKAITAGTKNPGESFQSPGSKLSERLFQFRLAANEIHRIGETWEIIFERIVRNANMIARISMTRVKEGRAEIAEIKDRSPLRCGRTERGFHCHFEVIHHTSP